MRTYLSLALAVGVLVGATGMPAGAQDSKDPKGVNVRSLYTSLGAFTATVNAPILVTGATVTLEPGGQTGRQQFRVPTFVYVVEGVLTTSYEAGPVGIAGAQYHASGQSFMDNGGWWHNHMNRTDKPVKYILVHLGYPGRPDPIQKPEAE
jgi:quercetin dioxygenase-like cupin family protein